ncbi:hypothetical protein [Mycolicibacter sinensis]|uniref:hypothetical protein n=1 Tax=Mycolicibacter sinensis (strain JDM601) TaxID=875328 RepID=UPI001041EBDD|nr:hypothetical protein [Mycolicibacter sinensis]
MEFSNWLSVAALALSLISIAWNFVLTYLRWPRLLVDVEHMQIFDVCLEGPSPAQPRSDSVQVVVVNRGAEAATIKTIGLHDGSARNFVRSDETGRAFSNSGLDPTAPIRVEGHGHIAWTFTDDKLSKFTHWSEIYAFVDVYKSLRLWPWWPRTHVPDVRRIESKRRVIRTGGVDQPA